MNPVTKSFFIILGIILSVFLVPAILIIFHDYIYAFIAITSFAVCFLLFSYYSYKEIYLEIMWRHLEEELIKNRFNGDPEKIRFYKGYKKYFDGDLNLEELERWFINHPRKN